jgi:hypothetical protein
MEDLDKDLFECELIGVLLPLHGLSDRIPYKYKTDINSKTETSKPGFPLEFYTKDNQRIVSIDLKNEFEEETELEITIWDRLMRMIKFNRKKKKNT